MWGNGGLYHAWASYLDRWSAGEPLDPAVLPALSSEDFTGDSWERFTNRLTDALSKRLQAWADELNRSMASARDEFGVARALGQSRTGLRAIRALASHPGLPDELRSRVLELVDRQVRSAQQLLEDQVDSLRRSGASHRVVEARLRTVRDNSLTVVTDEAGADVAAVGGTDWYADPTHTARRRITFE